MRLTDEFAGGEIPLYLIEGNQVGIGNYGEPVVKDIKIIKRLNIVELSVPLPMLKMDRSNKQIIDL